MGRWGPSFSSLSSLHLWAAHSFSSLGRSVPCRSWPGLQTWSSLWVTWSEGHHMDYTLVTSCSLGPSPPSVPDHTAPRLLLRSYCGPSPFLKQTQNNAKPSNRYCVSVQMNDSFGEPVQMNNVSGNAGKLNLPTLVWPT